MWGGERTDARRDSEPLRRTTHACIDDHHHVATLRITFVQHRCPGWRTRCTVSSRSHHVETERKLVRRPKPQTSPLKSARDLHQTYECALPDHSCVDLLCIVGPHETCHTLAHHHFHTRNWDQPSDIARSLVSHEISCRLTLEGTMSSISPHRATLLLVLSICSWVVCPILSPIAWILAGADLKKMEEGLMDSSGAGTTRTAKLIAMVHCILWLVSLVVGGLIFLLFAGVFLVAPNVQDLNEEASKDLTRINIAAFENAAQMYKIDNKVWPDGNTEEVVSLLMLVEDEQGKPRPSYLEKLPMDAWDEPLQYQYPPPDGSENSLKPLIWSFGPDRLEGTEDDITNIDELVDPEPFVPDAASQKSSVPDSPVTTKPTRTRPAKTGKENRATKASVAEKLKEMDRNRDGFIDRSEATGPLLREKFNVLDKNGDGRLSRQELKQSFAKRKRRKQ